MDLGMILQALLSLAFVIGLLLVTLWFVKYCEVKGGKCGFMKKLAQNQRLGVVEFKRIDAKNSLVLVTKDDKEYLLLLGASQNLVLENSEIKKVKK